MYNAIQMLIAWLATVVIEEAVAIFIFKIRDSKDLLLVFLVNTLTNPVINVIYIILYGYLQQTATVIMYLIGEPLVIFVEYLLYRSYLESEVDCLKLSAVANCCSIIGGIIWNILK